MSIQRAIPTRYAGILFRSKLEADWARAFDALAMPWEYEREGTYFGNVFYLPDFWLPRVGQYVEVKGAFTEVDFVKVNALCSHTPRWNHAPRRGPDIRLVAACPDGWFHGWPRADAPDVLPTELGIDLALYFCARCRQRWFAPVDGSVQCRSCGHDPLWPQTNPALYVGYVAPWPLHPTKKAA